MTITQWLNSTYGMLRLLNISEWSAILTAVATIVYTIGTFLLWASTRRTADLISLQLDKQIALGQSAAYHAITDAHKDIWLQIISSSDLAEAVDADNAAALRKNMIGTILINHCARIFADLERGVIDRSEMSNFIRDSKELFEVRLVSARWQQVKAFHQDKFVTFVNALHSNK